jgi:hypothetical protein
VHDREAAAPDHQVGAGAVAIPARVAGAAVHPQAAGRPGITEGCGIRWAADNDCFNGFDPGRYLELLEAISYRSGCLFVTTPDVVAEAKATLALFERWQPVLQRVWATVNETDVDPGVPVHQPIALVAQDGLERLPVPWDQLQALFIGGSTQWKLGPHAARLVREAKERGKWVHVGRVNTLQRIRWCMALGVDSIDGSGFARFTGGLPAHGRGRPDRPHPADPPVRLSARRPVRIV